MRWLLTSWGSHGDLHPFLALGRGLQARGHAVSLLGHPDWREQTEAAGIRFFPSGEPSREEFLRRNPSALSDNFGGLVSLHSLARHLLKPGLEAMTEALFAAVPEHDVVVAHHFVLGASVAAEKIGRPWATVSLAPGVVPSAFTPPGSSHLSVKNTAWRRWRNRFLWEFGRPVGRRLIDPMVNELRARHGLAPVRDLLFDRHSPALNLQLYSLHFCPRPSDWSGEKQQAGFCFYDPPGSSVLPEELEQFLRAGEAPVLCTLGSVAVHLPGNFYRSAAKALQNLGLRGVLLIGNEENRPPRLPDTILTVPYVPYGLLMPRVRAVFHQCGIGTLSHSLRAGVPSVACPFAFDQPNNARRLEALGVGTILWRHQHRSWTMTRALRRLLSGDAPARARALGEKIRAEDGVGAACRLLEATFSGRG